ncbi:MAG: pilus assembly protein [Chloroflexi bacterium]|nr:pilus assembly protein [Chloroflexota bacterium]
MARNHQRACTERSERGQAVLEFLLVLMILVPLLFGGIELARGVGIRHALDSGVGVAARALSLDPTQWSWANSVISQAVSGNPLGGGSVSAVTVTAYNAGGSAITSGALASLPFGAAFRLAASVTYTPIIPLVGRQTVTIRVSHWGIVERYP